MNKETTVIKCDECDNPANPDHERYTEWNTATGEVTHLCDTCFDNYLMDGEGA